MSYTVVAPAPPDTLTVMLHDTKSVAAASAMANGDTVTASTAASYRVSSTTSWRATEGGRSV